MVQDLDLNGLYVQNTKFGRMNHPISAWSAMFMGVSVPLPRPCPKGLLLIFRESPANWQRYGKLENPPIGKSTHVKRMLWNCGTSISHIPFLEGTAKSQGLMVPPMDVGSSRGPPPDHRHGHACPGPAVPHGGATPAPRAHGVRHGLGRGHGGGGSARGALCRVEQGASKCRRWDGEGLKDVEEGLENRGFPWFSSGFSSGFRRMRDPHHRLQY